MATFHNVRASLLPAYAPGRNARPPAVDQRLVAPEAHADDEARIDACGDVATLDRWIANGRNASSAAELLR